MEAAVRLSVTLVVAAGMAIGALQIDQEWLEKRAADLWNLPSNLMQARAAEQRSQEISAVAQGLFQRHERKKQIARAVFEGSMSLSEAADQFQEAGKDTNYDWDTYRATHPRWSLRVRCAHLVIDDVRQMLIDEDRDPTAITLDLRRQVAAWEGQ